MLSVLLSRALGVVALFGLISANCAHGSMHYVPNDIHCSKNFSVSFVYNSYTYITPLHEFANITKSFFDVEWFVSILSHCITSVAVSDLRSISIARGGLL